MSVTLSVFIFFFLFLLICSLFFFLMIRRPPRSTLDRSSAASDVYKRQVHPRPDERHIRRSDVFALKPVLTTEFNIEGYPSEEFIALVLQVMPAQVTLVPDPPGVLTSNAGWDAIANQAQLVEVVATFKKAGIRTSLFMGTDLDQIDHAARTGADRIELYTEPYAAGYGADREAAVAPFTKAAIHATLCGLGLNAGHDLSRHNLAFFNARVPGLNEVSIGHALICDALRYGMENTIQLYLRELRGDALIPSVK